MLQIVNFNGMYGAVAAAADAAAVADIGGAAAAAAGGGSGGRGGCNDAIIIHVDCSTLIQIHDEFFQICYGTFFCGFPHHCTVGRVWVSHRVCVCVCECSVYLSLGSFTLFKKKLIF